VLVLAEAADVAAGIGVGVGAGVALGGGAVTLGEAEATVGEAAASELGVVDAPATQPTTNADSARAPASIRTSTIQIRLALTVRLPISSPELLVNRIGPPLRADPTLK